MVKKKGRAMPAAKKKVKGTETERIIVRTAKYFNCYVARPSFRSNRVVAHGKDAGKVRQMAIKKGYRRPVVVFSPPKNAICLY